jgi:inosine/xanthosine triphosphatase
MIVSIASTRPPKINGVRRALEQLSVQFGIPFSSIRIDSVEAASAVADTPTSVRELMQGAENRARSIFDSTLQGAAFTVGVEGGLFIEHERVFLQSWTCVFNGIRTSFGASGCIEIPEGLAREVIGKRVDLGIAIDSFAKQSDVRSNQGTFGILTDDLVTREDSFAVAALNAFMPFFNQKIYGTSENK